VTERNGAQQTQPIESYPPNTLWIFDHREKREDRTRRATERNGAQQTQPIEIYNQKDFDFLIVERKN
jgi:hypothetical protein